MLIKNEAYNIVFKYFNRKKKFILCLMKMLFGQTKRQVMINNEEKYFYIVTENNLKKNVFKYKQPQCANQLSKFQINIYKLNYDVVFFIFQIFNIFFIHLIKKL